MKIRNEQLKSNVNQFYKNKENPYENPHEKIIHSHLFHLIKMGNLKNDSVMDLCCGVGQVSKFLKEVGFKNVEGSDPNANMEYQKRTGFKAYNYSFLRLSNRGFEKNYKYVICSFALHLCPPLLLSKVLYTLSKNCEKLIIISPNSLPVINDYWVEELSYISENVTTKIFKRK